MEDVFALGDCAGFLEETGKPVLPALAQVRTSFVLQIMHCFQACYMFYVISVLLVATSKG